MVAEGYDMKQELQATLLSPAEDESSREVFGLIKKLNIVPDTKKGKTPCKIRCLFHSICRVVKVCSKCLQASESFLLSLSSYCYFYFYFLQPFLICHSREERGTQCPR